MIKLTDLLKEINDKSNIKNDIINLSKDITKHVIDKDELTLNDILIFGSINIPIKTTIKNIKSQKEYSITGVANPSSRSISLNIKYNFSIPQSLSSQEIQNEIAITIWHEFKHMVQFIQKNQTKPEYKLQPRGIDYFLSQDEIEAYAEELYIKHELTNTSLEKLIQQFENQLNTWLEKLIQQRIKGGFTPQKSEEMEGTKEDIKNIISLIKAYLNKEYNLSL